jgi:hypothetical protein
MPSDTPPPHAALVQMATAHWVSHIAYVAAKLNLADHLSTGPQTAEVLAAKTQTHAPSLYRLMRTLANLGILAEDSSHRFALTPVGEALKTGAPGNARATILTLANPSWVGGWGQLLYSVQTGKPAFEKSLGMNIFDYFAKHPDEGSLFSETMLGFHGAESAAVAAAYNFSESKTIVDVGGATGNLVATILGKFPQSRGVVFDLPHVAADARAAIQSAGLSNRLSFEPGSFFENVPTGGDAYLLSHIIHDWPEDRCLTILRNCRRAMNPNGRMLIIEMVLPPGNTPHPGKMLDMMMLVGPGGQERTQAEYESLLAKADLQLARVVPTESAVSVVEARAT